MKTMNTIIKRSEKIIIHEETEETPDSLHIKKTQRIWKAMLAQLAYDFSEHQGKRNIKLGIAGNVELF